MQTNNITNSSYPSSLSFKSNINLSGADYTIASGGIYNIIVGSDGGNLYFPDPGNFLGARIVITNTGYGDNFNGDIAGDFPKEGATNTNITSIILGKTYNFISDGQYWRNLPLTGATPVESDGAIEDETTITKGGVYSTNVYSEAGSIDVYLVPAALLDGQTITIFNPSINGYECILRNVMLYDIENNVSTTFVMEMNSVLEIVSVGGIWRILRYQVA